MGDRIPVSLDWMISSAEAMRIREHTIISGVLQQPDYPPLPTCPQCGAAAERINQRMSELEWASVSTAVLIDFQPCGHRFRADCLETP